MWASRKRYVFVNAPGHKYCLRAFRVVTGNSIREIEELWMQGVGLKWQMN